MKKNYKELSRLRTALTLLRDARADISRVNSSYNKEAAQSVLVNAFLAKGVIDIYVDSEDVYIKDKQDDPKMLQLEIKSSQK